MHHLFVAIEAQILALFGDFIRGHTEALGSQQFAGAPAYHRQIGRWITQLLQEELVVVLDPDRGLE
jgi:hypothetical protein